MVRKRWRGDLEKKKGLEKEKRRKQEQNETTESVAWSFDAEWGCCVWEGDGEKEKKERYRGWSEREAEREKGRKSLRREGRRESREKERDGGGWREVDNNLCAERGKREEKEEREGDGLGVKEEWKSGVRQLRWVVGGDFRATGPIISYGSAVTRGAFPNVDLFALPILTSPKYPLPGIRNNRNFGTALIATMVRSFVRSSAFLERLTDRTSRNVAAF